MRSSGSKVVEVPDFDVCRLSYYINCLTTSIGIEVPNAIVDFQNADKLPSSSADKIFEIAATTLTKSKVMGKILFLDSDNDFCGTSINTFVEVTEVANVLATTNEFIIGGKVSNVTKVVVCRPAWITTFYDQPLARNRARLLRILGGDDMLALVRQIQSLMVKQQSETTSDHCGHCKGVDGDCACTNHCTVKASTKCSAVHHCSHCKGLEGACACKEGCPQNTHGKCVVIHNGISCDGCSELPIRGTRYKCNICSNYDACSTCYGAGQHDESHPFIRVERQGSRPVLLKARKDKIKMADVVRNIMRSKKNTPAPTPVSQKPPMSVPLSKKKNPSPTSETGKFIGNGMSISQMKGYLLENCISVDGAVEKEDVRQLVWETQIEALGAGELDAFMDAQHIPRTSTMSPAAKRKAAIAGFKKEEPPAPPSGIAWFQAGETVRFKGLSRANMNGLLAVVMSKELVDGRLQVHLLDNPSRTFKLKPQNLEAEGECLD